MPTRKLLAILTGLTLLLVSTTCFAFQQAQKTSPAKTKEQPAEEILTNDSVIQLLKVGIDEDIIISKIQKTKHNFDLSIQGMVALKKGGVSDRLMHFMMDPTKPPEAGLASSPSLQSGSRVAPTFPMESSKDGSGAFSDAELPAEMGLYVRKDEQWVEIQPEIVTWQTGGVLKRVATAGIIKGDVNGRLTGAHSRNSVKVPAEFLIVVPEGVAITEYQLIHLREQSDAREFRTVTGGVFHSSGGSTRDLLQFEGTKMASRTFSVKLSSLGAGEYGFLPPTTAASGSSATLGKLYTFRVGE